MNERHSSENDVAVLTAREGEGGRLDLFVARRVPGLSRRQAGLLAQRGKVRIDGRPAKKSHIVETGDRVEVLGVPEEISFEIPPDAGVAARLRFVHTSPKLIVVDKPSGIPSVPLRPGETGTVANGLVAAFPECAGIGRRLGDAGLVNRLDAPTSGLVLAARSPEIHRQLVDLQRAGRIAKSYYALVEEEGRALPKIIETPLEPHGPRGAVMRPSAKGLPARSEVRVLRRVHRLLLLEVTIHKGVRHQIRAHLAGAGHPIAGDDVYGGVFPRGLERLFLHAFRIRIPRHRILSALDVEIPLPPQLERIIE